MVEFGELGGNCCDRRQGSDLGFQDDGSVLKGVLDHET